MNDLVPGLFQAELFKPSSLYASAERVAYTIHARPQHTLPPTSRVVIEMPGQLSFNRDEGCEVFLTSGDCAIAPDSNTITLTNLFESDFAGGNLLKLMIVQATNPLGSREAGPWAIRSEIPVNGVFYVVDGQSYPESFFAQSGTIFTTVKLSSYQASARETKYTFSL